MCAGVWVGGGEVLGGNCVASLSMDLQTHFNLMIISNAL